MCGIALFLILFVAISALMLRQLMAGVGEKDVHFLQAFITAMITAQATAGLFFGLGAYFQGDIVAAWEDGGDKAVLEMLSPLVVSACLLAAVGLTLALRFLFEIATPRAILISVIINGTNAALIFSVLKVLPQINVPAA